MEKAAGERGGSWLEALSATEGDTSEGLWPVGNPHWGRDNPEGLQPRVTQVRGKKQQRETSKKHAEAERNQYTQHGRQKPVASPKGLGQTRCNIPGKSEKVQ